MDILNRPELENARKFFELSCHYSREHDSIAKWAFDKFGKHGSDISGCVREHFPEHVKDDLRRIARKVTFNSRLGYMAKPPRVHVTTMRRLAAAVAKRDGSGFYGPQPRESE